jgi:hypothetical protein
MASYKEPGFGERTAAAADARRKALDLLKTRPVLDEAAIAAKREAEEKRQAAAAAARAARQEALAAARAAKAEARAAAAPTPKTEEELKAERDLRYARRKAAKGKKG